MPTIEFHASEFGLAVTVAVAGPAALIDVCDQVHAAVPFSCRSASCGTCRVEVVRGGEHLDPARRDELDVLEIFAAPPSHRLACQARVRPGVGILTLRPVGADE